MTLVNESIHSYCFEGIDSPLVGIRDICGDDVPTYIMQSSAHVILYQVRYIRIR